MSILDFYVFPAYTEIKGCVPLSTENRILGVSLRTLVALVSYAVMLPSFFFHASGGIEIAFYITACVLMLGEVADIGEKLDTRQPAPTIIFYAIVMFLCFIGVGICFVAFISLRHINHSAPINVLILFCATTPCLRAIVDWFACIVRRIKTLSLANHSQ